LLDGMDRERLETQEDRDVLVGKDPKLCVCPFLG
jgi:hypothetical protein